MDEQLEDFIDATRTGRPPRVTAADGLQSVRLIERLYENRTAISDDWYGTSPAPVVAGAAAGAVEHPV
jgi:hypothetical protein